MKNGQIVLVILDLKMNPSKKSRHIHPNLLFSGGDFTTLRCADRNLGARFIVVARLLYPRTKDTQRCRMIERIKDPSKENDSKLTDVKACHLGWIEFRKTDLQTQHESSDTLLGGENGSWKNKTSQEKHWCLTAVGF